MTSLLAILLSTQLATAQTTPPPLMITDCFVPGPWIVFFAEDSARIGRETTLILDRLIAKQRDAVCGGFALVIEGHIDRRERTFIARRRADAVRRYLLAGGMTPAGLKMEDMGYREPRVAKDDRVARLQNRRVELHAAPPE